jgi:hypothetical protein
MKLGTSTTHLFLAVAVSLFIGTMTLGQVPRTPGPGPVVIKPKESNEKEKQKEKTPLWPPGAMLPPGVSIGDGTTSERLIAVDPKVSISIPCVTQGAVKVNGWSRNEVRVFISEGSKFGFRVLEKSPKDGQPVFISLVGLRQLPGGAVTTTDCISGDDIELDVPQNAAVSLKGRDTSISIDSIRKAGVSNVGGDINVNNVTQGVRASTYQGDVTVLNSAGVMVLESASGNIIASDISAAEVGDAFKAKTNSGAISLQKLGFRLAEVNSLSGTILFTGELASGGSFSFTTTNGSIRLALPANSSCRVTATYGFGSFNSELPVKALTEDVRSGPAKTINAVMGSGDATLRLTTNSGAILIKRL